MNRCFIKLKCCLLTSVSTAAECLMLQAVGVFLGDGSGGFSRKIDSTIEAVLACIGVTQELFLNLCFVMWCRPYH